MWGRSTAAVFLGMPLAALVVGVIALLSGDQKKIDEWRHEESVRRTEERRPDLLHD